MRAKATNKELTKAQIRASAIKELTWSGFTVWVQNNLAVRGRKFIGKRGQADIMGFRNKDGVILACEVKTVGDKLSDDQIKFLNDIKIAGGIAYLAVDNNGHTQLREWEVKK